MSHAWLFTGPPGLGPLQRRGRVRRRAAVRAGGRSRLRRVPRLPHRARRLPRRRVGDPHREALDRRRRGARPGPPRGAGARSGRRWQILIVEDADRLTEQACNALLKAIEEPTARTVWMLCAPTVEDVLPDDPLPLPAGHPDHADRRGRRRVPGPQRRRRPRRWRRTPPAPARATSAGPARWPATRRPATGAARWSRSPPG